MQLGNPPQAQSAGQFVTQIMPRVLEAGQSFALHALIPPQPHQDMPALYRRVDLFCLPSWWEAMPLTVLEAMAAGLPVVATSVGDIARMVHLAQNSKGNSPVSRAVHDEFTRSVKVVAGVGFEPTTFRL